MESKSNNILWVFLIGLIAYLMYNFSPYQKPTSKILSNLNTEVTVKADPQGHYIFTGEINGKKVFFLFDTGATSVAIPPKIANKLGVVRGTKYYSHTANGKALSYATNLNEVKVGDIRMRDVQGSIATGMKGNYVLLGMSFLRHVEITQFKGTLKLRVRQ
ncbi:MAG: retropepsin-like aspartic protease family protein [Methyloligellaceae bacterium]